MENNNSQRACGRRRRENVNGGRQHSHRVRVSPEEEAVLVRLAAEQRVSVPRLLMEAALSADHETPGVRRRVITELFALRRVLLEGTVDIRALVDGGKLDDVTVAAAKRLIERNCDLAERLDAAVDVVAAR